MRILLLLFLALAGRPGFAAFAANTISYQPLTNTVNDVTGAYTWTMQGTLPFVTTPTPCGSLAGMAGTFSDSNYISSSAAFNTYVSSKNTYTIEFYAYFVSTANSPVVFATGGGVFPLFLQFN